MRCFLLSRACGASLVDVINQLAVPEPRSAYFLLLVQEKVRKEKDTPVAAPAPLYYFLEGPVPCAPHQPRARDELAGAHKDNSARSGSISVSRKPSGLAPVLGLLYGDLNGNYNSNSYPLESLLPVATKNKRRPSSVQRTTESKLIKRKNWIAAFTE